MLQRVRYPAGLDIGAVTAEEIALSILTEIVRGMRAEGAGTEALPAVQNGHVAAPEAIDPICKMTVNVAEARYTSTRDGETLYFCLSPLQGGVRPGARAVCGPTDRLKATTLRDSSPSTIWRDFLLGRIGRPASRPG